MCAAVDGDSSWKGREMLLLVEVSSTCRVVSSAGAELLNGVVVLWRRGWSSSCPVGVGEGMWFWGRLHCPGAVVFSGRSIRCRPRRGQRWGGGIRWCRKELVELQVAGLIRSGGQDLVFRREAGDSFWLYLLPFGGAVLG